MLHRSFQEEVLGSTEVTEEIQIINVPVLPETAKRSTRRRKGRYQSAIALARGRVAKSNYN